MSVIFDSSVNENGSYERMCFKSSYLTLTCYSLACYLSPSNIYNNDS